MKKDRLVRLEHNPVAQAFARLVDEGVSADTRVAFVRAHLFRTHPNGCRLVDRTVVCDILSSGYADCLCEPDLVELLSPDEIFELGRTTGKFGGPRLLLDPHLTDEQRAACWAVRCMRTQWTKDADLLDAHTVPFIESAIRQFVQSGYAHQAYADACIENDDVDQLPNVLRLTNGRVSKALLCDMLRGGATRLVTCLLSVAADAVDAVFPLTGIFLFVCEFGTEEMIRALTAWFEANRPGTIARLEDCRGNNALWYALHNRAHLAAAVAPALIAAGCDPHKRNVFNLSCAILSVQSDNLSI